MKLSKKEKRGLRKAARRKEAGCKSGNLTPEQQLPVEPFDNYLEDKVVFSFRDAEYGGPFCIKNFQDNELGMLYKRLGHIEDLTWKQFRTQPRKYQLTPESPGSASYNLCKIRCPSINDFYHFRATATGVNTRIFVGKRAGMLHVVLFDRCGQVHH